MSLSSESAFGWMREEYLAARDADPWVDDNRPTRAEAEADFALAERNRRELDERQ